MSITTVYNYCFYSVSGAKALHKLWDKLLQGRKITTRQYFYPPLDDFEVTTWISCSLCKTIYLEWVLGKVCFLMNLLFPPTCVRWTQHSVLIEVNEGGAFSAMPAAWRWRLSVHFDPDWIWKDCHEMSDRHLWSPNDTDIGEPLTSPLAPLWCRYFGFLIKCLNNYFGFLLDLVKAFMFPCHGG